MKHRFGLLLALAMLSGCNEIQELEKWVEATAMLKESAITQGAIHPYRKDQHQALKAYFGEVAGKLAAIKGNDQLVIGFNKGLAEANFETLCDRILVQRVDWEAMMTRCARNRFFLCAEEVRAYPEIVSTVRNLLNPELQAKFDSARSCRAAF